MCASVLLPSLLRAQVHKSCDILALKPRAKMNRRFLFPCMFLFAACTPDNASPKDSDTGVEALPDYSVPGPWTAASTSVEIVGATGVSLPVQIWYPTLSTSGDTILYDGLLAGAALDGAAPDCAEVHPVVAFSHGSGGIRWQSPFFGEHLASHGWIVVAPDHIGNTFLDDGSVAWDEIALRRPQDLADAVDWLFSESGSGGSYENCADPSDGYAVVGHSFGGYTTYVAAGAVLTYNRQDYHLGDDRVWAGVAWAPWDFEGGIADGAAAITVPMATLGGTLDETLTWASQENLHNHLTTTPRALGEFPNAGHFSFSPVACDLAGTQGDGCGDGFIDLDVFVGMVQTSTLAFLAEAHGASGAFEQRSPDSAELSWTIVSE